MANESTSGAVRFVSSPVVGRCSKHGDQIGQISVTLDIPEKGGYCLTCYAEWLAANITKLDQSEAPNA